MAKSKRVSVAQQNKPSPAGSSGKADRSTKRDSIGGGISKKGKRKERKQTFLKRLKEAQDHLALGATNADVLASVRQIGDSLPDFKTRAAAPKRSKPLSNKSRQKLFTTEVAQFASVLQHPSFNEDPLSAIRLHLENTVDTAPLAEETEAPSDEDTSGPIRSRLDKKKLKGGKSDSTKGPGGAKLPIGKKKAIKRSQDRKRKEIEERGQPVSAREARRRGAKALSAKLSAGKAKVKGIRRAKSAGLVKAKKKTVKF